MAAASIATGPRRAKVDLRAVQSSWRAFDGVAHVRSISNAKDHKHMVALMNTLLDVVGDDEAHALSSLLDVVGDLVWKYEQQHHAIEAAAPKDMLRFLMEARDLKQGDLAAVVAQINLSAILAGKRKINASLATRLAQFFGIKAGVFVAS